MLECFSVGIVWVGEIFVYVSVRVTAVRVPLVPVLGAMGAYKLESPGVDIVGAEPVSREGGNETIGGEDDVKTVEEDKVKSIGENEAEVVGKEDEDEAITIAV